MAEGKMEFANVRFVVSTAKEPNGRASRKPEHQNHYSVNVVFRTEKEKDEAAVKTAVIAAQQLVRVQMDIDSGREKAPRQYQAYPLKPVVLAGTREVKDDEIFEATATIYVDGRVKPDSTTRALAIAELVRQLRAEDPEVADLLMKELSKPVEEEEEEETEEEEDND